MKMLRLYFLLFFLLRMGIGNSQNNSNTILRDIGIFNSFYGKLLEKYVDPLQSDKLMRSGIAVICRLLDPYTVFTDSADIMARRNAWKGVLYSGIGVNIIQRDSVTVITSVNEGGPAARAGLRPGDQLLRADSIRLTGKTLNEVTSALKGKEGSVVNLQISRPVSGIDDFMITREKIIAKSLAWYGMLDDSIGYIRCEQFLQNSYDSMLYAFRYLRRNDHFCRLILDFRDNIGGLVQDAVNAVNLFIPKGKVVCSLMSVNNKGANYDYITLYDPIDTIIPVAILVNNNTISAGEIFTGAMQDYDRAIVTGTRTYGKGYVQGTHSLAHGAELYVTSARYYTPSGRCIQALDLTHQYIDGSVNKISDSLKKTFYTANRRPVKSNGGIEPDIFIESSMEKNELVNALVSQYIIFDFAARYRNTHEAPPEILSFKLQKDEYSAFEKNTLPRLGKIKLKQENSLEALLNEGGSTKQQRLLKKALFQARKHKYTLLRQSKEQIIPLLEKEILSHYYGFRGRVMFDFGHDQQLKEAVRILRTPAVYSKILNRGIIK